MGENSARFLAWKQERAITNDRGGSLLTLLVARHQASDVAGPLSIPLGSLRCSSREWGDGRWDEVKKGWKKNKKSVEVRGDRTATVNGVVWPKSCRASKALKRAASNLGCPRLICFHRRMERSIDRCLNPTLSRNRLLSIRKILRH